MSDTNVSDWCVEYIRKEMHLHRDGLSVDLFYPRNAGNVTHIKVGLSDVRAADEIRISYDFERDGWKIEQASIFSWDADDEVMDSDWQEVAFVKVWNRQEETL